MSSDNRKREKKKWKQIKAVDFCHKILYQNNCNLKSIKYDSFLVVHYQALPLIILK